jgi:hypothetical protein
MGLSIRHGAEAALAEWPFLAVFCPSKQAATDQLLAQMTETTQL